MAQVRGSAATAVMIMVTMSMLFHYCQADVNVPWSTSVTPKIWNVTVGEKLTFSYANGAHNVVQVAADNCGAAKMKTLSYPSSVSLNAGTYHYICTVGQHCQNGMKITVNVIAKAKHH